MKYKNLFTPTYPEGLLVQNAGIRKVNPHDPEDMRRISVIDNNSEVLKQMVEKQLNDKGLLEFVTNDKKEPYTPSLASN